MRKKLAYSTKKSKMRVYVTWSNCVETLFERAYIAYSKGTDPMCWDGKHIIKS